MPGTVGEDIGEEWAIEVFFVGVLIDAGMLCFRWVVVVGAFKFFPLVSPRGASWVVRDGFEVATEAKVSGFARESSSLSCS